MDVLVANIADPTDFADVNLQSLDRSLRCNICCDLFDAPVTLQCGHAFCSLCLRDAMSVKQECPSCRKPANEGHFRPIPVLEDIISAWKASRPLVLQLSKGTAQKNPSKKRKRSSSDSDIECMDPSPGPSLAEASPKKRIATDYDEDSKQASCPICSQIVAVDFINEHIDSQCQTFERQKSSDKNAWSKLMKGKGKEKAREEDEDLLPKVTYATLKEKQLKDLLHEQGLPTTGDRVTLESRHKKWRSLFNANLDKSLKNRATATKLRKELQSWEDQMKMKRDHSVKDCVAHEKQHKKEFDKLVAIARKSRNEKQEEDIILVD